MPRGTGAMPRPWHEIQSALLAALRDPRLPYPDTLVAGAGGAKAARFNVYRNNSAVSLTDALAANFPVTQALVGELFFAQMARSYMAEHPPPTPVLLDYGATFADFIAGFTPAQNVPFLPDVARLERFYCEAFNAADATALTADRLSDIPQEDLCRLRLHVHPSARLLSSDWPIFSIWQAHQTSVDPADALAALDWHGEAGALVRPDLTVQAHLLAPVAFDFLSNLKAGYSLEAAIEAGGADVAGDLAGLLSFVFAAGFIVGVGSGPGAAADEVARQATGVGR